MLRGLFTHNTLPNLFTNHPPFQMDGNFGYPAALSEMLLQSQEEGEAGWVVDLLPALPDAWPDGSVTGLKARGNLTVDIQWKDGKPTAYHLRSPKPRKVQVRVEGVLKTVESETLQAP
jgi:alpha-L-fucosidase 2